MRDRLTETESYTEIEAETGGEVETEPLPEKTEERTDMLKVLNADLIS